MSIPVRFFGVVIFFSILVFCAFPVILSGEERLLLFAGAASKPPTEEAVKVFTAKTGIQVDVNFGGSGTLLSQILLGRAGDLYFPGSSDYMERAKLKGVIATETERIVVYLVPSINVWKGNPKKIQGLKDLLRADVRVAIANPESVCLGTVAVEIAEKLFTPEEKAAFRKNISNYTESCDKTASAISLKSADAVIGWSVIQYWDPERIETIPFKPAEVQRVGTIPIAVTTFAGDRALAGRFIEFLLSEEGKAIFHKHKYFMSPEEAFEYIGEKKPVGGEYQVPAEWIKK